MVATCVCDRPAILMMKILISVVSITRNDQQILSFGSGCEGRGHVFRSQLYCLHCCMKSSSSAMPSTTMTAYMPNYTENRKSHNDWTFWKANSTWWAIISGQVAGTRLSYKSCWMLVILHWVSFHLLPNPVVLATDGRLLASETSLDFMLRRNDLTNHCFVLCLSGPETHSAATANAPAGNITTAQKMQKELSLSDDPGGVNELSLHLFDDCNSLHATCKSSLGAYLDSSLIDFSLLEAADENPVG